MDMPDGWINPTETLGDDATDLVGVDGNAFAIIGFTYRALRRAGNTPDVCDAYREAAVSGGDYGNMLRTSMQYLGY